MKETMQKLLKIYSLFVVLITTQVAIGDNSSPMELMYWMKIKALNKFDRTKIEEMGIPIEIIRDDYVISYGYKKDKERLSKKNLLIASSPLLEPLDFPIEDSVYHNYSELTEKLKKIAAENSDIVALESIGKSVENRDLWHIRISTHLENSHEKPAALYLGGHHAREHLSVDIPLRLMEKFIESYRSGDQRVVRLIETREIHIVPMVNPDGAEYDISTGNYRMWRKNRRNNKGSWGVDLNRNYGYKWGTGGASSSPQHDTYRGPEAFSEPETQAIKNFIERQTNITILLSFHTFSELILYPWGHQYEPISNLKDLNVYSSMANKMSEWNKYKPMQSSSLYITSGDTTDWAYGQLKIFAFTFELDPTQSQGAGGFYPGPNVIPSVVQKNWEPFLFLMEYADNPYRITDINAFTNLSF